MALIFKFQMTPQWIFHLGAATTVPCDRYTRSNIMPIFPLCNQCILKYRIISSFLPTLWFNHQVVGLITIVSTM